MKKIAVTIICFLIVVSASVWQSEALSASEKYWPQWRGPEATGVAPQGTPPVEWDESKNIRWKIEIPGKGHASPIVWEDKIFILTAIETDKAVEIKGQDEELPEWRRRHRRRPDRIHSPVGVSRECFGA